MVADLSRDDMIALGNFFAAQKPVPIPFKADRRKVDAGRRSPTRCCARCATSAGSSARTRFRASPASIHEYVVKQLQDFKAKRRTNDAGNMTSVAGTLSDDDIENLAHYIANL